MRKILLLIPLFLVGCSSNSNKEKNQETVSVNKQYKSMSVDEYINVITGFTCEKAQMTDNGYLVIAIDAVSGTDYDNLATQFLDEANSEGVTGIKGVLIVDSKDSKFEKGTVIGDRIGKAYN